MNLRADKEMLKKSALIIDDNIIVQEMARRTLEKEDFSICVANNGKEALEILENQQFSVILTDIQMPVMDGFAFLEKIKPQFSDPYEVIAVTAHGDNNTIKRCFQCGVGHFLSKPLNSIQLKETVKRAHMLKELQLKSNQAQESLEQVVEERTKKLTKSQKDLQTANNLLENAYDRISIMAQELEKNNFNLKEMAKKANAANKAKSDFFAKMNHEIRTPLTVMLGEIEMLNSTDLDSSQQEHVDSLISSGNMLKKMASNVLDLSKIESGKLELEIMPVDLKAMLLDISNSIKNQCKKRNIEFLCYFDREIPELLLCDPLRVRQIILNLLSNALKFTDEGSITLNAIVNNRHSESFSIAFEIKDTGCGIPVSANVNIFNEYSQAENSTARKFGGTGLGLSICSELAKKMESRIIVKSEEGKGSSFSFILDLPTTTKGKKEQINIDLIFDQDNPPRALVVEDNPINQGILRFYLNEVGCEAHFAISGKEALKMLSDNFFCDIIFMDRDMPGISGTETTRIIRKEYSSSIPIIAFSALSLESEMQSCLDAGMNDFLLKPIEKDALHSILENYLDNNNSQKEKKNCICDIRRGEKRVFNEKKFLKNLKNNYECAKGLASIFIDKTPHEMEELKLAIACGDFGAISQKAHYLKGMSAHLNAGQFSKTAEKIETTSLTEENIQAINEYFNVLSDDWQKLNKKLTEFNDLSIKEAKGKCRLEKNQS